MEQEIVIKASLIAYKYNNGFTLLVYENKGEIVSKKEKFVWVAIPPRWKDVSLEIGETVMLRYFPVKAGEKYYDSHFDTFSTYKTSINWFRDAIHLNHIVNKTIILDE